MHNELNLAAIERLEGRLALVQDAIEKLLVAGQNFTSQAGSVEQAQFSSLVAYEKRILNELSMRTRGSYSVKTKYTREWANLTKEATDGTIR